MLEKRRVKRLEKKGGSRTHRLKRLYKVGLSRIVESSEDEGLDEEDAFKQGRIDDIDANEDIYLVNVHRDEDMFVVNDLEGDDVIIETEVYHEVVVETKVASKDVNLSVDKVTLAQALAALKSAKPKADKVMLQEPEQVTSASTRPKAKGLVIHEEEQATTPTVSSQQPSQVKVQDKSKGIMVEEPLKMKKKDQISFDEQETIRLQAKFDEEERLARKKDEANVALIEEWNDIQAKINADYQLAQRLQAQEQEELTDKETARLFVQFLEERRKHFAAKRAEEKRNRPSIRAQQRSIMCIYLKNMEGWKPKSLKNKSFANIQELFDKAFKRVNTFVNYRTELIEESSKKVEAEIAQESSSKRAREAIEQESSKKQKVEEDKESEELKNMYLTFGKMLKNFNREDLEVLWSIVKDRFKNTEPMNYMDNFLLLNLKTMFEHHVEDSVWKNQQGLVKVLNWKLYDSCGVYCVTIQSILYYLLVEKMYPLTNHTLYQTFNDVKLQVDYECEMAFELLRLVKKQLKEDYGSIFGIKSLLEVTVAKVDYVKLIYEDIIHKLNKKTRENVVPYPRFISLLLEYMLSKYDNEELTINPTQAICNLDVPVTPKLQNLPHKLRSSANDKSPSHPSPPTLVVGEMHKEVQQAAGGLTSLGATSKEGAHPQLNSGHDASADSTAEADPRLFTPIDSIPIQQGINKESKADENSKKIKLEDLSDLLKDTRYAFFTLDSPQDEPIIVSYESEEEETKKAKDTHTTSHNIPEDTLVPYPSSSKSSQIQELMAQVCHYGGNASGATTKDVPLAGQATASPAEGEKNTNPAITNAEPNLHDEVIDLLGIDVRKVVQACPDRKEKGWKTIHGLIKTRMKFLDQTEKELKIDFNKPLKEQDPVNKLNDLANKKRKRTGDSTDHSRLTKKHKSLVQHEEEVLRRLGSIFTSVDAAVQMLKKVFGKSFSSAWLTIPS
ncbi:hypothetical protein Tco_0555990 [Tanacetum coccineum]